jgi:hypothetical protein
LKSSASEGGLASGDKPDGSSDSQDELSTQVSTHFPIPLDVFELPFDIDGNVTYRLLYIADKRMKSSLDGSLHHKRVLVELDASLIAKEAINVLTLIAAKGSNIKVQIEHSLRKKAEKLYAMGIPPE